MLLQSLQQRRGAALAAAPAQQRAPTAAPRPSTRFSAVAAGRRRSSLWCRAGSSALAPPPPGSNNEESSAPFSQLSAPRAAAGGQGGAMGGSATLQRSKSSFVMPTPTVSAPKLDMGGSGGDNGKHNHHGGGGGDGDDGDDDDYFGEGDDDGEGGDGFGRAVGGLFRTTPIPEQYDAFSVGAVLAEWMRTVADLPAILRQAVTMGLFSSAQLVRFFAVDVRPNVTRAVSRRLPPNLARDFVGRLMADPGFVQKAVIEASVAAGASLWFEYRARREAFKGELDLVAINTLGMAAATAAAVWMVAPSRSYGAIQKYPWQQVLSDLPNCVFEASGPMRNFTPQLRLGGMAAKVAELSAVGALTGTATSLLSSAAVSIRQRSNPEWQPSVAVPSVGHSSGGLGAYFATNANVRYQLLGGLDRLLFAHTNYLWMYMALSGGARLASQHVGEMTRPKWQGLPDPLTLAPVHIQKPAALSGLKMPRRVKKKISKRVPKYQPLEQQQQQAAAASAAAAAAYDDGAYADEQQQEQPQMELQPLSYAEEEGAAAPSGGGYGGGGSSGSWADGAASASMAATAAPTHTPQLELDPLSGDASNYGAQQPEVSGSYAYAEEGGGGGYDAGFSGSGEQQYYQQQQQQVQIGGAGSESEGAADAQRGGGAQYARH